MKVKNIGYGVLVDEDGRKYMADVDGWGHVMNLETGEIYMIISEGENGEIELTQDF